MAPTSRTLTMKTNTTSIASDMASTTSDSTIQGGIPLKPHRDYQDLPFKCTYEKCLHRFETEKEMKRHKVDAPDHYFCKKCNVDCEDWAQLTAHKVELMAPFVDGRKKPSLEDPPMHITCEFCGEDFGSFKGRLDHRAQRHPANQDVTCPGDGCGLKFVRAADMVAHLEKNKCIGISAGEFRANIQHRFIHKQIMYSDWDFMMGPQHVLDSLNIQRSEAPGLIKDAAEQDGGEDDGGVILDQDDEDQAAGHEPLEAEVKSMQGGTQDPQWPVLAGQRNGALSDTMRSMSISSSSHGKSDIGSEFETASQATTIATNATAAWSTPNTAKALFPAAKPTSPDYDAVVKKRQELEPMDDDTNLWKARIWDPSSSKYSVELFRHRDSKKYCCPLPACAKDNANFDSVWEFEYHMRVMHLTFIFSCPSCLKRFETAAALVAHAESTKKCGIRSSRKFKSFIDEMTGGFLQAKEVHVPKLYKATDVVKAGQGMGGVMDSRYTATRPTW